MLCFTYTSDVISADRTARLTKLAFLSLAVLFGKGEPKEAITTQLILMRHVCGIGSERTANATFAYLKRSEVVTLRLCSHRFSLIQVIISSSRRLSSPHGGRDCLPLYPTDGTLRHRVCFPKAHSAGAATQGKPSALWHSFERASRTTSHGLQQKNVDFSQSFYSSVAGLGPVGSSPSYFMEPPIHSQHLQAGDAAAALILPKNTWNKTAQMFLS